MKIEELKKRYPDVKFYELKLSPDIEQFRLSNLEDFFKLAKIVGDIEMKVSGTEEVFHNLESLVNAYINDLGLTSEDKNAFFNYISEHLTSKLCELIDCEDYDSLKLYGLDFNVNYKEDNLLNAEEFDLAMKEIDRIFNDFQKAMADEKESREKGIHDCIMSFKEKYDQAGNKTQKDNIIKNIKFELKSKFGIDARNDERANEFYIISMFENEE